MFGFGKKAPYDEAARRAIEDALDDLLYKKRESFFGYMALSLKLVEDSKKANGTCSTDGTSFFYDPAWIKSLPHEQLVGAVSHAVLRKAYLHPYRRGERDEMRWNLAGHLAARKILRDHGFQVPPDGISALLVDLAHGRSTEQIYDVLEEQGKYGEKQPQPKWGAAQEPTPGSGEPGDEGGEGPADAQEAEDQAKKDLARAMSRAKEAGEVAGDLQMIVQYNQQSTRDWRDSLRRFLGGGENPEQSWSRANRRYIADGDYLPGAAKYGPGEVVVAIDSSSSVDDDLVEKFIAEVKKINIDLQPDRLHIVVCDARVQWTQSFGPMEDVYVEIKGRGGTNFAPVFHWIDEQGINAKAVVYFSDLFGPCDYPVSVPLLWIAWPGAADKAPNGHGEVIRM